MKIDRRIKLSRLTVRFSAVAVVVICFGCFEVRNDTIQDNDDDDNVEGMHSVGGGFANILLNRIIEQWCLLYSSIFLCLPTPYIYSSRPMNRRRPRLLPLPPHLLSVLPARWHGWSSFIASARGAVFLWLKKQDKA